MKVYFLKSFVCAYQAGFDSINEQLKQVDETDKEEAKREAAKKKIVENFFQEWFPDALELMKENLYSDFINNPVGNLVTVKCYPHHYKDKLVLIGDAAHAIVPFYGQGMNASLQDVQVLDELIERFDGDFGRALAEYSTVRKPDTDAIADLAFYNYVEMRDHVNHSSYKWRKTLDNLLHRAMGEKWIPLYTMVSFRTIPYAKVIEKASKQDKIVSRAHYAAYAGAFLAFLYYITRNRL